MQIHDNIQICVLFSIMNVIKLILVWWNIVLRDRSSSMVGILGNVTKTQTALSSTASYADSSDSKVTHLSAYADSLSSYNYQYVRNKTEVRIIYSSWLFKFIRMKCVSTSSSAKFMNAFSTLLFFTFSLTHYSSSLSSELSHCLCWQWILCPYRVSQARTRYVFYCAWPHSSRILIWKKWHTESNHKLAWIDNKRSLQDAKKI